MPASGPLPDDEKLLDALRRSQRLGMLGPGPVGVIVEHSSAFVGALADTTGTVVDLGSGGGVPGLVIAWLRPDLRVRLVDRRISRTDHLRRLVSRLGLAARVEVVTADVASLGPTWLGAADAVVTRGLGPSVWTLRSAVPLVEANGIVVISEPPAELPGRWPPAVLDELGLTRAASDRRVAVFRRRQVSRETSSSGSTMLDLGGATKAGWAPAVQAGPPVHDCETSMTVPDEGVALGLETAPGGYPLGAAVATDNDAALADAVRRPLPRVIAIANQKGGVGKTTTTINLGVCLAELGQRTLVIDLDPQANASTGLGIENRGLETSMYHVLMHDVPLENCIEPTDVRGLFVAPASLDLAGAEIELVPAFSRETRLRRAVQAVMGDYDYVLIDCPPSLGLLTVNGLSAAHEVLVPIQCEYYALEGLGQLLRNVDLVRRNLNPQLDVSTIVCVMYDARTKLADQVVSEVRDHFGEKVVRTVVPRSVRLSEAPSYGQPIITFDPRSRGAVAYRDVAREVHDESAQRVG